MSNDARADEARPVALGTGLLALDVVYGARAQEPIGRWAGGTCGNVLTILSCLGWSTYPVARFRDDVPARIICDDLATWGVHLDHVMFEAHGSTPVIIQYNERASGDSVAHRFSFHCPVCGSRMPGYRPVPVRAVSKLIPDIPPAQLFFFDRTSRGAIRLATALRESGATVVFEPSSPGDPDLFQEALSVAHIVKFSRERWSRRGDIPMLDSNWLQMETLGKDGLRFRSRLPSCTRRSWQLIPGLPVDELKDTAGSGDWCTAGIVAWLCAGGAERLWRATEHQFFHAIERGQRLAAWNCGFEGARGGMYGESRRTLTELTRDLPTASPSLKLVPRRQMHSGLAAFDVTKQITTGSRCASGYCHAL